MYNIRTGRNKGCCNIQRLAILGKHYHSQKEVNILLEPVKALQNERCSCCQRKSADEGRKAEQTIPTPFYFQSSAADTCWP